MVEVADGEVDSEKEKKKGKGKKNDDDERIFLNFKPIVCLPNYPDLTNNLYLCAGQQNVFHFFTLWPGNAISSVDFQILQSHGICISKLFEKEYSLKEYLFS